MKKSVKVKFGGKILFSFVVPGLVLLALMLSFPASASAKGDEAGDAKIQAMKTDIMACMQQGDAGKKAREAFAKKYNVPLSKVNENVPATPPAGNGGWDRTKALWICGLEEGGTAGIGVSIWDVRRGLDGYKAPDVFTYCVQYSMYCDHYNWEQGCLKKSLPNCCY